MPIVHSTQVNSSTYPNDPSKPISTDAWNEEHTVDGQIEIPVVASPSVPAANTVAVYGRNVGGRIMLTQMGPSGLDTAFQPFLGRNKISWINPRGNSTTIDQFGITATNTGTVTSANVSTANIHTAVKRVEYAVTTASTTAVAGWRSSTAQFHIGSPSSIYGGFHFVCRFGRSRGSAANSTLRGFTGLSSLTTAPTDANPSTSVTNAIGVGCDSTDTNYQIIHRSGTSTATKIDTGIPKAVSDTSELYDLIIFTSPSDNTVHIRFVRLSDNADFIASITTNKPADTTLLAPRGYYSVGGTSSVIGYALCQCYIETDY